MHKNKIILILGLLVAYIPYSGFSFNTKKIIIAFFGLLIAVLAFLVERHIKISFHWPKKKVAATTYVEHNGSSVNKKPTNLTI